LLRIFIITVLFYLIPNTLVSHQAYAFYYAQEDTAEPESNEGGTKGSSTSIQRSNIKIVQPINAFDQHKEDLHHYLSKNKTQLINTGSNEYILIEESSSTQNSKGVAILIPDWQQGLTSPKAMNDLRKNLPDQGWGTFSVQSPNKPKNYPSNALSITKRAEQNKMALMPYRNELKSLIMEVMKKAGNYPGIFLVITQGSQAALLVDLYKNNPDLSPTALVILSAGMYTRLENESFAKNVSISTLPVLDLVLKKDNPLVLNNAQMRKKYTTKEMKVFYRQKMLTNMVSGYYPEKTLLVEINGWLKTIGW
jgi:hypothetical protein